VVAIPAADGTLGANDTRMRLAVWPTAMPSASTPAACSTPPSMPHPGCAATRAPVPKQAARSSLAEASHRTSTTLGPPPRHPSHSPRRLLEDPARPDRPVSTTCLAAWCARASAISSPRPPRPPVTAYASPCLPGMAGATASTAALGPSWGTMRAPPSAAAPNTSVSTAWAGPSPTPTGPPRPGSKHASCIAGISRATERSMPPSAAPAAPRAAPSAPCPAAPRAPAAGAGAKSTSPAWEEPAVDTTCTTCSSVAAAPAMRPASASAMRSSGACSARPSGRAASQATSYRCVEAAASQAPRRPPRARTPRCTSPRTHTAPSLPHSATSHAPRCPHPAWARAAHNERAPDTNASRAAGRPPSESCNAPSRSPGCVQ